MQNRAMLDQATVLDIETVARQLVVDSQRCHASGMFEYEEDNSRQIQRALLTPTKALDEKVPRLAPMSLETIYVHPSMTASAAYQTQ